jgi:tetratricopeptide (TPR) repeat protein
LNVDPHNGESLIRRADLYNRLGECQRAEQDADTATQTGMVVGDEKRATAFTERGDARFCQGRYDAAMSDFTRAAALYPAWAWPVVKRCENYRALNQPNKALEECNEAVRKAPDLGYVLAARAEVFLVLKRYTEALADAQKAAKLGQKDAWTYDIQGRANEGLGRWDVATADYDEALRLDPDRILSYLHRALARRVTNDPEGSQRDLSDVKRLLSSGLKLSAEVRGELESQLKALSGDVR